jgi:hypothetical protein
MKTILVTIVSDQTIPNVLFIKEKQREASLFLFITTAEMEQKGKTNAIIKACHLGLNKTQRILVNGTKPAEVIKELRKWIDFHHADQQFLVNLTGGTKMMALAIHSLFSNFSSGFYYLPIGKNTIVQVLEQFEEKETPLRYRLSLYEYLKANSLQFSIKEGMVYSSSQCNEIFKTWEKHDFRSIDFPLKLAESFSGFDLQVENAAGEWFEEYIYFLVKEKYKLTQNRISSSVMIFTDAESPQHDNEFDLMWVHENELYVAECKVTLGKAPVIAVLKPLYKLSALSKNFGLKTNSYLLTLSKIKPLTENLKRKLKILNISDIIDYSFFKKYT